MAQEPGSSLSGYLVLGILGGGQLAKMLCEAAKHIGVKTHVAISSHDDPAAAVADTSAIVDMHDPRELSQFCAKVDTLLFESEFADFAKLSPVLENHRCQPVPKITAIEPCADKLQQKHIFDRLGIATAKHLPVNDKDPIDKLFESFPQGYVLKWSRQGYDGKGNLLVRPDQPKDIEVVRSFIAKGHHLGAEIYAEACIDFAHEVALVTIRDQAGICHFYPLVVTQQQDGICHTVLGPADQVLNDPSLQQQAQSIAKGLGDSLDLVGCYAVEYFLDRQGKLLANEIAPRVHNSGHCTLDSAWGSQFDNHIRAALNLPISDVQGAPFFAMVNILGPKDVEGTAIQPKISTNNSHLYWYGKIESRPGRKLGHINTVASDLTSLKTQVTAINKELADWSSQLHNLHQESLK